MIHPHISNPADDPEPFFLRTHDGVNDSDPVWVSSVLRDSLNGEKHVLYITHYPEWYESGGHPEQSNASTLRDTLAANVRDDRLIINFSGHRNTGKAWIDRGVHYYQCPGTDKGANNPAITWVVVYDNYIWVRPYSLLQKYDGTLSLYSVMQTPSVTNDRNWFSQGFWIPL